MSLSPIRTVARKFSIRGLGILKLDENSTDCFIIQIGRNRNVVSWG